MRMPKSMAAKEKVGPLGGRRQKLPMFATENAAFHIGKCRTFSSHIRRTFTELARPAEKGMMKRGGKRRERRLLYLYISRISTVCIEGFNKAFHSKLCEY